MTARSLPLLAVSLWACTVPTEANDTGDDTVPTQARRVPAEWEPHGATWIQWPNHWEASMRPAFADIVDVVQDYEALHLISGSEAEISEAQAYLSGAGVPQTNITWHAIPMDNAWMRDNGPIYIEEQGVTKLLDFRFDAWGGNFGGHVTYQRDDAVPQAVAELLGIEREDHQDYVLERGNLELNGAGIALLNYDCQQDRNPSLSQDEHEELLMEALGLHTVIWAYGHHPSDLTTGHIDGSARFVDEDTILINESSWGAETEDALVQACKAAGLEVIRMPGPRDTDYMNYLEGNGFVAGMRFGDAQADADALALYEQLFPERDIHMIDANTLWAAGGGIHCVTNDQPALP
jgi:agmatine deiminase